MRLEHGLNFSVRMGLNSGEVIVGKIGDSAEREGVQEGLARRSWDRPCQPRLWPSFSSRGLQAVAKFVQASPSPQTPATSPVSPLK
jgi:hypothetical protein